MFILPYGHDQSVYGRPYATWALIAINALVFAYTYFAGLGAESQVEAAARAVYDTHLELPDARIDPALLLRAPDAIREVLRPLADDDGGVTDEDAILEDSVRRLLRSVERVPAHRLGYRPGDPSPLTFFSSAFVHADLWHLLGNMFFLWLAGAVIECFWGARMYLVLYAVAAAIATGTHHLAFPDSLTPLVGASGAVSGILGAFVVGYPRTRIRVLYFAIPIGFGHLYMPAWLLIPLWAALQLLWALIDDGGGVAHWAHVGGFAIGIVAAIVMKKLDWVIADAGDGTRGPT